MYKNGSFLQRFVVVFREIEERESSVTDDSSDKSCPMDESHNDADSSGDRPPVDLLGYPLPLDNLIAQVSFVVGI